MDFLARPDAALCRPRRCLVWTIRLKSTPNQIIGSISLHRGKENNRGFWIIPEYQGQGLMTEACEALTEFWLNTLKMPTLRVPKAIPNLGSRRRVPHRT
jgi:ribosomal-protein-alanine N-acetyltransferase